MTQQEINIIKNEILDQIQIDAKLIEQLIPEVNLKDADLFEIDGGRYISFKTLSESVLNEFDLETLYDIFLRKDKADRTPYRLSSSTGFEAGNYVADASGAYVNSVGNAEVESIVVRSYMKVFELIYNRLNALEGDMSFADSGTIESIVANNEDGSIVVEMRKRWDGDFTAFQIGDVVYGYVNNLQNKTDVEYYKAWALVLDVDRVANTLTLAPYNDIDVPADVNHPKAGVNHPMAAEMLISRWGNALDPEDTEVQGNEAYKSYIKSYETGAFNPDGTPVLKWVNTRQQSFYISTNDGNIVELMGVNKPILELHNYGTVLGQLPDGFAEELGIESYINPSQPYLYARGIVVQDILRVDYNGVPVQTPNYCGEWSAERAADEDGYYRNVADSVDIVIYDGALWQCATSHASANAPGVVAGEWICITTRIETQWQIVPSVNTIYIRNGSYSENLLECRVEAYTTNSGIDVIGTAEELDKYGMELVFTLDGVEYNEFWVREGADIGIETDGGDMLEIGGNNVPWLEVQDYITLTLRDQTTKEEKRSVIVPVVRDGEDGESVKGDSGNSVVARYQIFAGFPETEYVAATYGTTDTDAELQAKGWSLTHGGVEYGSSLWRIDAMQDGDGALVGEWSSPVCMTGRPGADGIGKTGPLVYPAGVYDENTIYTSTDNTRPVVLDGEQYYILKEGKEFYGHDIGYSPSYDVTYKGGEYWELFDNFVNVFAEILMADFAKLNAAVFWNNLMISQYGTDNDGNALEYDGAYRLMESGGFTPNLELNFLTGEIRAWRGTFGGSIQTNLVKLEDSDAEDTGASSLYENVQIKRIRKDFKLLVPTCTQLELPTSTDYIGAEITICETSDAYTRTDITCPVTIKAQDGDAIGGIDAAEREDEYEILLVKTIQFRNGVVKFLGIPAESEEKTKWVLMSTTAQWIQGSKY